MTHEYIPKAWELIGLTILIRQLVHTTEIKIKTTTNIDIFFWIVKLF